MSASKWVTPAWTGPDSPQGPVKVTAALPEGLMGDVRDIYLQGFADGADAEQVRIRHIIIGNPSPEVALALIADLLDGSDED